MRTDAMHASSYWKVVATKDRNRKTARGLITTPTAHNPNLALSSPRGGGGGYRVHGGAGFLIGPCGLSIDKGT